VGIIWAPWEFAVLEHMWTDAQKHTLLRLATALRTVFGFMPVVRHSDLASTECPGLTEAAWRQLVEPISLVG
jgi:hypothetical protein